MAWHPFRNIGLKLAALGLGTALWFVVSGPRVDRVVSGVPVNYRNTPATLDLSNQTQTVDVHVRGVAGQVSRLQPNEIQVTVDLYGRQAGLLELPVPTDQITAPMGIEVAQVEPAAVSLLLERRDTAERTIPAVSITIKNRASSHKQVEFDPETVAVTVRGSTAALGRLDAATVTAEIDLAGLGVGRHVLPVRATVGGTLTTALVRPATVTVQIR